MNNPVLNVNSVSKDFGGIRALDEVDLMVGDKEIVALIGPNGAGKTTFFNCITGIYSPTSGSVLIDPEARVKPCVSMAASRTSLPSSAWRAPFRIFGCFRP